MIATLSKWSIAADILQFTNSLQENGSDSPSQEKGDLLPALSFDFWSTFITMVFALSVIVGLIFLISWLMRKTLGSKYSLGSSSILEIVSSLPLGDRKHISIVRVGKRYFLVGISNSGINLLTKLEEDEVEKELAGSGEQTVTPFSKLLRRFRGEGGEVKQ